MLPSITLPMILLAAWLAASAIARADAMELDRPFEIPPAPMEALPKAVLEVHTGVSTALENAALCPVGSGCVFQSGGGIGATVERRWPRGLGLIGGYDAWFLGSDSVYELGVQQVVRVGGRYTPPTDIVLHPMLELSAGGMGYGDTFAIATVGVLMQALAGMEVELNERFGLVTAFGLRAFSHSEFRTRRDSVLRGRSGIFSESFFIQVGLTVM